MISFGRKRGVPRIWRRASETTLRVTSIDWKSPVDKFFGILFGKKVPRDHIGYASCSFTVVKDDRTYIAYKYNVFRDERRERNFLAQRTMFVDPESHLPVRFETPVLEDIISIETRRYDARLKVEAPVEGK